jgi:hypothetical protein
VTKIVDCELMEAFSLSGSAPHGMKPLTHTD